MKRNILILVPRMDVTFKKGPVQAQRGPIPPIRVHWLRLIEKIAQFHHERNGDEVTRVELPLWQFTEELVEGLVAKLNIHRVYIPHKERARFIVHGDVEQFFYMQSVFPWQFYIDTLGFAGGASIYPLDPYDGDLYGTAFDELREYALAGGTKFDQPKSGLVNSDELGEYVLFPCQIPHDETIKYHSDISVETALLATIQATLFTNHKLIVKGHPVNPGSMETLKEITAKYPHATWMEGVSIHDLLPKAKMVVVVNSGTGMEALLRSVPVATFGRCEYDCVTHQVRGETSLVDALRDPWFDIARVRKFFDKWTKLTYNSTKPEDFLKLKEGK